MKMIGMNRQPWLAGAAASLAALMSESALAGSVVVNPVPTLDEFALFGLTAAVGLAGIVALVRRRK